MAAGVTQVTQLYHPSAGLTKGGLIKRFMRSTGALWAIQMIGYLAMVLLGVWFWQLAMIVVGLTLMVMATWHWYTGGYGGGGGKTAHG